MFTNATYINVQQIGRFIFKDGKGKNTECLDMKFCEYEISIICL